MSPPGPDRLPPDIAGDVKALMWLFLETRRRDLDRLDAALEAGDFATIRAVGHLLRGSAATFGFAEAGRLGARLEKAAGRSDRESVRALVPLLRASLRVDDASAP
jgi:HPt (histidine-containing phosphotransfer) domain-containing protein